VAKYRFENTTPQRSANMRRIKNKDTAPELVLRRALWAHGLRGYRLHRKDIAGTPDITYPARKIAIFIDGSFWHGHDWERRRASLKTNKDYWIPKIERNMLKDEAVNYTLLYHDWTVLRYWDFEVMKQTERLVLEIAALFGRDIC
jgi:DNA mismatch endonuclease, patch repair protein